MPSITLFKYHKIALNGVHTSADISNLNQNWSRISIWISGLIRVPAGRLTKCSNSFPCWHQSFHRVSWKADGDCRRNADKSPKMPYSAIPRKVKKWSAKHIRHWITTKRALIHSIRRRFWHATHDCVAPYVDIIPHTGQFWAKSSASGSIRWCCFRSCLDGAEPRDAGTTQSQHPSFSQISLLILHTQTNWTKYTTHLLAEVMSH